MNDREPVNGSPHIGRYEDLLAFQQRTIEHQSRVIEHLTQVIERLSSGGSQDLVVDAEVHPF